ncbi:UbiA family prenyltransferase [Crateriforma conspicua]|uniref:Prenyltransferase n=1 Tax=Crateriforma conspicua TaxID=2527996 RepID=A0A5C5Y7M9_9PLAN|nr:UbiA family prenyltransferase [Crateriforma conspicua]QDV65923.1 prenyltransferase [Crateriforma conspicua]TWT71320.1 prenyltransferase [Crateriforma conspicua]
MASRTESASQADGDNRPQNSDPRPSWLAWGQLVRLPNVFTVLADVAAGYLIVAGGAEPVPRFVAVLIAGVLLYWAGMILNDVFDVQKDRQQRPQRPLASGAISVSVARAVGIAMLVGGVIVAAVAGQLVADDSAPAANWTPAMVAAALAVSVLLYDGPLKATPVGPLAMGMCRVLSFLLGAAPHFASPAEFPTWLLGMAAGMGMFVMGVTTIGRREAEKTIDGFQPNLWTGTIVVALGGAMVGVAPRLGINAVAWQLSPGGPFLLLVAMVVFPVVVRGFRAARLGTPDSIQSAVRSGVLTIIPLAAAIAFLGAGPFWGLLIFAGVMPALGLSRYFRVT